MAQCDMFLKIEGVEGECTDDKFSKHIEILSWSWGETQAGSHGSGGGGGAGKVSMQDFHFVCQLGKHTPLLMQTCAAGQHLKKATLFCRKAGGKQEVFLKIDFNDLLISSYQTGCSGGQPRPTDQCSFNYTKIVFCYDEQKPDGTVSGNFTKGWDLAKNVKV